MFRAGLVAALALLALVSFPPSGSLQVPDLRVGVVAAEDVMAPFDFPVLRSERELADLRDEAESGVAPVFRHHAVVDSAVAAVDAFLRRFEGVDDASSELARLNRIGDRRGILRSDELRALTRPEVQTSLRSLARQALPAIYAERYMIRDDVRSEIAQPQISVITESGEESIVPLDDVVVLQIGAQLPIVAGMSRIQDPMIERLVEQLFPALLPGNLEPQPSLTATRRQDARRGVSPVKSEVLADELIVGAHTRVTQDQAEKLRSLKVELERRNGGWTVQDARAGFGKLLLSAALLALFGFFLFLYRADVYDDYRAASVIALVWATVIVLGSIVHSIDAMPDYSIPVAFGAVTVAILWDARLSIVFTLFLALFLGSQIESGVLLMWTAILGGLAGAWSVRRFRRRTQFYETLLFIIVGHAIALGAIGLIHIWGWRAFLVALGWLSLSAAASVFMAMGLMPVFEWISGRTTDLTLLELADLNRPLLRQLMLDAPGTYHHSIVVGNLSESAAEEIGLDSLLLRVGAYYHDIGKMQRPGYFAENQRAGVNPHTGLTPEASARIVSRHVSDGVEMAEAAGLPERVIDFIREHHGTTRLTYFWHQAEAESDDAPDLGDFAYPGPRPRSKETAVLMLADSVEAASRVVEEPTEERLRGMVQKIISMKLDERQLDEADLTFRELAVIEDQFVTVLQGIHHQRIDYPSVSLHAPVAPNDASSSLPSAGRSTG